MKRILAIAAVCMFLLCALPASAATEPVKDQTAYQLKIWAADVSSKSFNASADKNIRRGDTVRVIASLYVPKGADLSGYTLSFTGMGAELWLRENGASEDGALRYAAVELSKNAADALKKDNAASGGQGGMRAKAPFIFSMNRTANTVASIDGLDNKGTGDLLGKLSEEAKNRAQTYIFAFYAQAEQENASVAVSLAKQPGGKYGEKYADVLLTGRRSSKVTTSLLSEAEVDVPYAQMLTAAGARPLLWTIVQGRLPKGLRLNRSSGLIYGAPEETGLSEFAVRVSGNGAESAIKHLHIGVSYAQSPILKSAGEAQNNAVTLHFHAPVAGKVNASDIAITEKDSGRVLNILNIAYPPDERAVAVETAMAFSLGKVYTVTYKNVTVEFATKDDPLQNRIRITPNFIRLKAGDRTPQHVLVSLFDPQGHPLPSQPVSIVKWPNAGFMGEHMPMMNLSGLSSGTFMVWWQDPVPAGTYEYLLQCGGYFSTLVINVEP